MGGSWWTVQHGPSHDITILDPSDGKGCNNCLMEAFFYGKQCTAQGKNDNYRREAVFLSEERKTLSRIVNDAFSLKGKLGADSRKYNLSSIAAVHNTCPGLGVCIRECRRAVFVLTSSFLSIWSIPDNISFKEPISDKERQFIVDVLRYSGDYKSIKNEEIPGIDEKEHGYLELSDGLFDLRINPQGGGCWSKEIAEDFTRCINGNINPQELSKIYKVYVNTVLHDY